MRMHRLLSYIGRSDFVTSNSLKLQNKMVSDTSLSIAFNIIASLCGWGAIGMGIAGIVSQEWEILGELRRGLWDNCAAGQCFAIKGEFLFKTSKKWLFCNLGVDNKANPRQRFSLFHRCRKV